jgi:hypothetical protein
MNYHTVLFILALVIEPKAAHILSTHFAIVPHPQPFFFFFSVLGFELKAYTLSQSTNPFFVIVCFWGVGR